MKIVYAGNGLRGKVCLESLLDKNKDVVSVLLHEKRDFDMEKIAKTNNILICSENPNSENTIKYLQELSPDLVILSGYNYILKKPILNSFERKIINLHGGKVPDYRGASVIPWAIINGETNAGCSILYVNEGIDTGNILASQEYSIHYGEEINDVVSKTLEIFPKILEEAIQKFSQGDKGIPQLTKGQYYHKRREPDNEILWNQMSSRQIYNLVRSQTKPYLGAFTHHAGEKIRVWKAKELGYEIKGKSGEVLDQLREGVVIMAKDRGILIKNKELKIGDILGG